MLMTSQSLVRHEQEGRRCEALVDKSEHQSSLSLTRLLPVADTLENKSYVIFNLIVVQFFLFC